MPRCVVPAVADQHALVVADLVGDAGIAARGRPRSAGRALAARERRRQPAARVDVAEQHPGDRRAAAAAGVPGLDDAPDLVAPGRQHRAGGLEHDDRAVVGGGHALDQLVALQAGRRRRSRAPGTACRSPRPPCRRRPRPRRPPRAPPRPRGRDRRRRRSAPRRPEPARVAIPWRGGDQRVGLDVRRAAAVLVGVAVGADHRQRLQPRRVERQRAAVVLQQHDARLGQATRLAARAPVRSMRDSSSA